MGNITKTVIEFLTTDKDCTLISSEIGVYDVFTIAEREGREIVNPKGKKIKHLDQTEKYHYIKC